MKTCYKCGISSDETKLYATFGKSICRECLSKRKRAGKTGNSGMVYDASIKEEDYVDPQKKDAGISLLRVPKSHPLYVKWFIEHYPESKGIVGRQLNYLIYDNENPIGIIGFASPPLNYKKFNQFFGFNGDKPSSEHAKFFLNNNAFRIVHTRHNIGTQVLKLAREAVWSEYGIKYGNSLLGLVTFVEPPRTGAIYKADNWEYIGETEGIEVKRRGEEWTEKQYTRGQKKYIYGYKYSAKKDHRKPDTRPSERV